MTIDTQVVARYLQAQRDIFRELQKSLPSQFNDGIIQGMNLALTFIANYEKDEGDAIAKYFDSQQHAKEEDIDDKDFPAPPDGPSDDDIDRAEHQYGDR